MPRRGPVLGNALSGLKQEDAFGDWHRGVCAASHAIGTYILRFTNYKYCLTHHCSSSGHLDWPHIIGIILVFLVLHAAQVAVKGTRLRASHFWFLQAGVASPQARLLGEPGNLVRESEPLRAQARLAKV